MAGTSRPRVGLATQFGLRLRLSSLAWFWPRSERQPEQELDGLCVARC